MVEVALQTSDEGGHLLFTHTVFFVSMYAEIIKSKTALFGHAQIAHRNNRCNLVKTCILGMMLGKRRRGDPGMRMQDTDNVMEWARASLEENVRLTEDRTAWRERSCAAGTANVRTDYSKVCTGYIIKSSHND